MENKGKGLAIAAFVCSLAAFVINPLSILPLVAIILAIVSLATKKGGTGLAIAALCIAPVASFCQAFVDTFLATITMGIGVLLYLI